VTIAAIFIVHSITWRSFELISRLSPARRHSRIFASLISTQKIIHVNFILLTQAAKASNNLCCRQHNLRHFALICDKIQNPYIPSHHTIIYHKYHSNLVLVHEKRAAFHSIRFV
jgi:hypothetical protein